MTTFRPACWATSSTMPVWTAVVYPCRLARASYRRGAMPGTVKYPFASVATLRLRPVSRFVMTTSTPGSTPPVWSLTVPEMVADVICPAAGEAGVRRTTARITRNIIGDLLTMCGRRVFLNGMHYTTLIREEGGQNGASATSLFVAASRGEDIRHHPFVPVVKRILKHFVVRPLEANHSRPACRRPCEDATA